MREANTCPRFEKGRVLYNRLKEYLEKEKVPYQHEFHRTAYTAQEVADEQHVPGKMESQARSGNGDEGHGITTTQRELAYRTGGTSH